MATDFTQTFPQGGQGSASDGDGQGGAADAAGVAKDKAQAVAGQAQEKAQQAAGQVQDKLREQIDQRSGQAAEQINTQASDLRSVSDALRKEGKDGPADAADRLAGYAEKVGGYLQEKDSHALLADAEEFGRQRPWAAVAGGLVIGLAASRFLKASSGRRYQSRTSSARPDQLRGSPAVAVSNGDPLALGSTGTLENSNLSVSDDPAGFGSAV
jgi:ElaB/YqjD/DUF883 family membrane-anchored ribosome-binding protein